MHRSTHHTHVQHTHEEKQIAQSSINPPEYREFTKQDYYGFAGALKFRDGSLPLLAEYNDNTIIVLAGCEDRDDAIVAEILFEGQDGGFPQGYMAEFPSVTYAQAYIQALIDCDCLDERVLKTEHTKFMPI